MEILEKYKEEYRAPATNNIYKLEDYDTNDTDNTNITNITNRIHNTDIIYTFTHIYFNIYIYIY